MAISWRAKKQLSVILIILLPVIAAVWLFAVPRFFLLEEPTCFDGKPNQGELGVDCGGPCASCELLSPKSISVTWARAIPLGENLFDAAALIENKNVTLAAPSVEYEFRMFDEFGEVARRTGTTFLLPQERTYVIEVNLQAIREPTRVEFKVKEVNWEELKGKSLPVIGVEKKVYKVEESGGVKQGVVEASLFNRSIFGFKTVELLFLAFDADGNLLAANKVAVESFLPDTRREVRSVWPQEIRGELAEIIVEPRVNILGQGILLRPQ